MDDAQGYYDKTKDLLEEAGVEMPGWVSDVEAYFPDGTPKDIPEDTEMGETVVTVVEEPSFFKKHKTLILGAAAAGVGYMLLRKG